VECWFCDDAAAVRAERNGWALGTALLGRALAYESAGNEIGAAADVEEAASLAKPSHATLWSMIKLRKPALHLSDIVRKG
jgi:hypothetical protein